MRFKNLDLISTLLIALLNMLWLLLPNISPIVRSVFGLPLVLILPGYALAEVLFYKRSLTPAHRLVISLGLSLTIDIVGGFILNILPGGLRTLSWGLLLGMFTVLFSLLAIPLRLRMSARRVPIVKVRVTFSQYLLLGLATVILIGALSYNTINTAQMPHSGFTQLWMLPSIQSGKSCSVQLGIQNLEATTVTYRASMTINGEPVTTWSSIRLTPQQKWQHTISITPQPTDNLSVEVQLYRLDTPQLVYRKANVTFSNAKEGDGPTRSCGTPHGL